MGRQDFSIFYTRSRCRSRLIIVEYLGRRQSETARQRDKSDKRQRTLYNGFIFLLKQADMSPLNSLKTGFSFECLLGVSARPLPPPQTGHFTFFSKSFNLQGFNPVPLHLKQICGFVGILKLAIGKVVFCEWENQKERVSGLLTLDLLIS